MASRRDLIQSFQFAARRVVSAVVLRQTDPREWPFRRLGGAGLATIMLTVVALAAAGVYGMIVPGGKTSWRDGRSVIIDKDTGAAYVFISGTLHPVVNFTSAALLAGTVTVTRTATQSLAEVPHGVEVGIMGAPSTLPGPDDVIPPPWALCTEQVDDDSGTPVSRTRLVVGRGPGPGRPVGDSALLVTDTSDGREYVIWRDTRHWLTDPNAARIALRLDTQAVNIDVGGAWLKALPAGQAISPITSSTTGRPSAAVRGARVGQVFKVTTADQGIQWYLAGGRTLIPITDLQAQLQEATGAQIRALSPSAAAAAAKSAPPAASGADPPTSVPGFIRPQSADPVICGAYRDGSSAPQVLVDSQIPAGAGVATTGQGPGGEVLADRIVVPAGRAALVQSLPSPRATSGPLYLVTDTGRRFAIPSEEVLRSLGLGGAVISRLPSGLLVRIPEGPPLSPEQARQAMASGALSGT